MISDSDRITQLFPVDGDDRESPPVNLPRRKRKPQPLPRLLHTAMHLRGRYTLGTQSGIVFSFTYASMESPADFITLRQASLIHPTIEYHGIGTDIELRIADVAWLSVGPCTI